MTFIYFLIILILLFCGGLFSAIETAITASSPGQLLKLSNNTSKQENVILIIKIKSKIISTMLIFATITTTIATTIATNVFIDLYGVELGSIITSVVMTIVIIIFAEVLPKAIAVSKAEKIVVAFSDIIFILLKILAPINFILSKLIRFSCFVFHIKLQNNISPDEEVMNLVEYQHAEGKVFKQDRDMVGSIFDIKNLLVSEIMVHRSQLKTVNVDLPLKDLLQQLSLASHTRIPMWKSNKDNIIGIIHVKDLLKNLYKQNFDVSKINITDLLTEPWFIPENVLVSKQLHEFRHQRYHCALVVNEYGDILGMVTLEDVLEEIVGRIEDEHDSYDSQIILKEENQYIIDGLTPIRDINRELNWSLYGDASTIGGLIISELKRIPEEDEVIELFDLRINILRKSAHRIKTLLVTKLVDPTQN